MKLLLWPITNQANVPAEMRRSRIFFADGTEMTGVHAVDFVHSEAVDTVESRMAGARSPAPRRPVKRLVIEFDHPEVEILDALPPNQAGQLRDLIAQWRVHWSCGDMGADKESANLGSGIEKCADELEALLDQLPPAA